MLDGFKGSPPERKPETKNEKAFFWLLILAFSGMMIAGIVSEYVPRKLSIIFFLLSWPIWLVIHEFGHALMAKAVGWKVELVSIGTGKIRATSQILGMKVEFRSVPLSGYALPRPDDLIQPRLKNFLIYAAGPGIEIAIVLFITAGVGFKEMTTLTDSIPMIALQAFCLSALFGAITNLIPLPHAKDGGYVWSDGLGMIMSWGLPDEYFARQIER